MTTKDIEITVQSLLPADEPQGRYRLRVSPETTVEHFLKQLCQEAGAVIKSHYCLRSKGHNVLNMRETLAQSGIQNGAFLHWTGETEVVKSSFRCNTFWILALGSFIIGTAGIVAICIVRFRHVDQVYDFAIVFDAGSSHTSMFIYKWEGSKLNGTAVAAQYKDTCKVLGGGISSYANDPPAAGRSLQACINQSKSIVPVSEHYNTPVYLGATAGMRLLQKSNATATAAILDSVREVLSKTPYKFTDPTSSARIISGSEEGAFSWITSNYLANVFKADPPGVVPTPAQVIVDTIGAMDLGGASTQITFIPKDPSKVPDEYSFVAPLFGRNYSLYTYSYLCYGVNEQGNRINAALVKEQLNNTVVEHPCLPSGYNVTMTFGNIFASACVQEFLPKFNETPDPNKNYTFVGLSKNTECIELLNRTLFNKTVCDHESCSFNNVYQPEVFGIFYAFSNFYYSTDFLNMSSPTNSSFDHQDFRLAVNKICSSNWSQLQQYPTSQPEKANLMNYCQQSNFIDILLQDGYGFNDSVWKSLNFVRKVSSTDIGWTLGFVLKESNGYPSNYPEVSLYTWTFAALMVLFCLFLVVSVALAIHGCRHTRSADLHEQRLNHYGAI